jgi:hypothetical protein
MRASIGAERGTERGTAPGVARHRAWHGMGRGWWAVAVGPLRLVVAVGRVPTIGATFMGGLVWQV